MQIINNFLAKINDSEFWNNLSDDILFYVGLIACIVIAKKIVNIFFDRYFQKLHLKAQGNNRTINKKRYKTLASAFKKISGTIIWITALFIVLEYNNVNTATLLTGAGAAGLLIGIAGKDIIMDWYVGLMALIEDQYRVGDVIWIDQDHSGTVEQVNLRTVVLRDLNGSVHVIPHSLARAIKNLTYDFSRVVADIGVAYDTDIEKLKKVINDVGLDMLNDPEYKELFVKAIHYDRVLRFDESQITVRAIGDVKAGKQWAVSGEYNLRLKRAFDEHDIEIPFPQRVMHMAEPKKTKVNHTKAISSAKK